MAAGRIKGITIEINGDTSKLTSALASVDNSLRNTKSNLRDIQNALKLDPTNITLLKDKHQELGRQIEDTKTKIEMEKEALRQMENTEGFDKNSRAAQNLKTQIDLDTAALKELQAQGGTALGVLGDNLSAWGDKFQEVGRSISRVGDSLTKSVTVPIVGAGAAIIKETTSWESAFTGVKKTVDETYDAATGLGTSYDMIADGLKKISTSTASTKQDIAAVAEAAGQLGVGADSVVDFTRVMVELGDTTNLSADEAATAIAQFANITGMSIDDADRLGAVLVDLGNNFATDEESIMSMASRLAGAGAQFGLSESEILGFSAALSSVGIKAEMGGSAFSKAMIKMQVAAETGYDRVNELQEKTGLSLRELQLMSANSSKDFKALADSLGLTADEMDATVTAGANLQSFAEVANMTTEDFVKLFRDDSTAALQAFIQGLGDTDTAGESTIQMLEDMGFTEVRLRDTLTRLASSGDLVTDSVTMGNKAWEENTALIEEANKRYGTTESKLSQAGQSISNVAIKFGEILAPMVLKAVEKLEGLLDKLNELDEDQRELIVKLALVAAAVGPVLSVVGRVTTGIGGIMKVLGPLVTKLGSLTGALAPVGASFGQVAGAVAAAAAPVLAIAAAIGVAIAAFKHLWETNSEFRDTMTGIWEDLKAKFQEFIGAVQERLEQLQPVFETIMNALSAAWDVFCNFLAPVFEGAWSTIAGVLSGVMDALIGILDIFTGIFTGNWEQAWTGIKEYFAGIWEAMESILNGWLTVIQGWGDQFLSFFGTNLDEVGNSISTHFNDFITWFQEGWTNIVNTVTEFFAPIVQTVTDIWNDVVNTMTPLMEALRYLFETIWGAIQILTDKFLTWAHDTITSKWQEISDRIRPVLEAIREFMDNVWNGIKDKIIAPFVEWITTTIPETWQSICDSVNEFLAPIVDFIQGIWDSIKEGAQNLIDAALQWGSDMLNNFIEGVKSKISFLTEIITGVADGIHEFLHFSKPDKGPLSDFDTYGPDMMKLFAEGIVQGFEAVRTAITNGLNSVKLILDGFMVNMTSWTNQIQTNVMQFLQTVITNVNTALQSLITDAQTALTTIQTAITTAEQLISGELDAFIQYVSTAIMNANRAIVAELQATVTAITTLIQTASTNIQNAFQMMLTSVHNNWTTKLNEIRTALQNFINQANTLINNFASKLTTKVNTTMSSIKSKISTELDSIKSKLTSFINTTKTDLTNFFKDIKTKMTNLKTEVTNILKAIKKKAINVMTNIKKGVQEKMKEVVQVVKKKMERVTEIITEVVDAAHGWGSELGANFAAGIMSQVGAVAAAAQALADAAHSYIGHSVPERGPLSDDDEYGAEMVQNFIEGIVSETDELRNVMEESFDLKDITEKSGEEAMQALVNEIDGYTESVQNALDNTAAVFDISEKTASNSKKSMDAFLEWVQATLGSGTKQVEDSAAQIVEALDVSADAGKTAEETAGEYTDTMAEAIEGEGTEKVEQSLTLLGASLSEFIEKWGAEVSEKMTTWLTSARETIKTGMANIKKTVKNKAEKIREVLEEIAKQIGQVMDSLIVSASDWGAAFGEAFAAGMESQLSRIQNASQALANASRVNQNTQAILQNGSRGNNTSNNYNSNINVTVNGAGIQNEETLAARISQNIAFQQSRRRYATA